MKYKKEFEEACIETNTSFDTLSYIDWLETEYEKLKNKCEETSSKKKLLEDFFKLLKPENDADIKSDIRIK